MKKYLLLFLLLILSMRLYAQEEVVDSLKLSLNSYQNDLDKANTLLRISDEYLNQQNFDSSYLYSGKAFALSEKIDFSEGVIKSNNNIGRVFSFIGKYDSASKYYLNSLRAADNSSNIQGTINSLISLGENSRAYRAYYQGKVYLFRALETNKKINDSLILARIYNRLAAIYFELKNYDSTVYYAEASIIISENLQNKELIGSNLSILGVNYANIKDFKKSIEYLKRAEVIFTEIDSPDLPNVLNSLGAIYNLIGNREEAIIHGLKSYNIAVNNHIITYIQMAADVLFEAYEAQGNYKESLKYIKISTGYKDSLYNVVLANKINEYNSMYDVEKSEKENDLLKQKQSIKDIQIKASAVAMIAAIALIVAFLFYFRKNRKVNYQLSVQKEELEKISEELKKLNKTKDKFFSIIAHDLRNPFNSIIGFSDLLANNYDSFDDNEKKEMLFNIKDSSLIAHELLENLLQWSRSQSGTMQVSPEDIDLNEIALENVGLLRHTSQFKEVFLHSEIHSNTMAYADLKMISTVIRNLMSNGIKFTPKGGEVKISAKKEKDFVKVSISDTGIGIKKESIEKLFRIDDSYKRAGTEGEEGSGLGLIVCKEFIEKNGGKIWVESEQDQGSRFIFTIPAEKS
ncbi:MAG TPA: tetratricopeptide repeat-containing sensor histidine kinase [Ignavibacteria bacterium]